MITKVVGPCLEDFKLALLVFANPAQHVILFTIATGRPNQVNNPTEEPERRFHRPECSGQLSKQLSCNS